MVIEASLLPLEVDEAVAEVALPEPELAWVEDAVDAIEAEVAARASAVAFRVPHCSFDRHVA